MNLFREKREILDAGNRRRRFQAAAITLLVACGFATGCANKNEAAASKPTPAQVNATIQRADQEGPAIAAANQAYRTGK